MACAVADPRPRIAEELLQSRHVPRLPSSRLSPCPGGRAPGQPPQAHGVPGLEDGTVVVNKGWASAAISPAHTYAWDHGPLFGGRVTQEDKCQATGTRATLQRARGEALGANKNLGAFDCVAVPFPQYLVALSQ